MKILIVNAILYTNEAKKVKKVNSIKDCMICDLCTAFVEKGHDVTLLAADDYLPMNVDEFSFDIVWEKSYLRSIFPANKMPFNIGIFKFLKHNKFDMIISSEVFSMDTLLAVLASKTNLIIWQEMAFHQRMAKQLASKIWHNVIVKHLYRNINIVPRTRNAQRFIKQYSNNVTDQIIPHGINLKKFEFCDKKEKTFVVCSQLIERKQIDKTILQFRDLVKQGYDEYKLYIIGDGDAKEILTNQVNEYGLQNNVVFTGKLSHKELIYYLSKASAMLIYTAKDNSMISIAESIAVGTPVVTTSVPDNASTIKEFELGVVSDNWDWKDLKTIIQKNENYVSNCFKYRENLDNLHNVEVFVDIFQNYIKN